MVEARRIVIGGLPITALSRRAFAQRLVEDWRANHDGQARPRVLTSANGNVLSVAHKDPSFRALLDQVDVIDADGQSLVIASRYLASEPLPERVATTDFFHDAAQVAEREGMRFFLLGSTAEENARAIARMQGLYPKLHMEGHHGYFTADEEDAVVDLIRAANPDVLWIGLGIPREQVFALRHRDALKGVIWIKTCGGLFNFLSGKNSRAPALVQNLGLEWAWRTILEPRRLLRRYLTTNLHAIWLMAKHRKETRLSEQARLKTEGAPTGAENDGKKQSALSSPGS